MKPVIVVHRNIPQAEYFKKYLDHLIIDKYSVIWDSDVALENIDRVEVVVIWQQPITDLTSFKNLRLVLCCGSGINQILNHIPNLPKVNVIRLVDDALMEKVSDYVITAILCHYTNWESYIKENHDNVWSKQNAYRRKTKIGIMGIGKIGSLTAECLSNLGFEICGWANDKNKKRNIKEMYYGNDELNSFAKQSQILFCMLPLTYNTYKVINKDLINHLQKDAYIINVGRGQHVEDTDLMESIKLNHISGACLDGFIEEPLPSDNPLWKHPKIKVTPHIAGGVDASNQAEYAKTIILEATKNLLNYGVVSHELCY